MDKLFQNRNDEAVHGKDETVRMECELDSKTKAYHIPESGGKKGEGQQSLQNISSEHQ